MNTLFPTTVYGKDEICEIALILSGVGIFSFFYSGWLFIAALAIMVFVLCFFRNPKRHVPTGDNLIICPADGKVAAIDEVDEPNYIKGKAVRIAIFMNVFNVHVNRYPVQGEVELVKHTPGKYHNAASLAKTEANENTIMGIKGVNGHKLLVKQIAGLIARRIVCPVEKGAQAVAGETFGMIKFSSRVDVFIPLQAAANLEIELGEKVVSGETILGRFSNEATS